MANKTGGKSFFMGREGQGETVGGKNVGRARRGANSHSSPPPQGAELTPQSPRKRPLQERSQHTVDVIVEAATRVFDQHGLQATTNQVAELAGVSIGSLYQYFPNKLALITELHERHRARVAECVLRVMAAGDSRPRDLVLAELVSQSIAVHREHPGLQQVLHAQLPQLSQQDERSPGKQRLAESVRRWLQTQLPGATPMTRSLAAVTLLTMGEGLVHQAVLNPGIDAPDPELTQHIVLALCGYLDRLAELR